MIGKEIPDCIDCLHRTRTPQIEPFNDAGLVCAEDGNDYVCNKVLANVVTALYGKTVSCLGLEDPSCSLNIPKIVECSLTEV